MTINREIQSSIRKYLGKYPVIAVTGPRQSGKTTMLKAMLNGYRYVSLENPDIRSFAEDDPNGFLKIYDKYVIFDEAQRVPSLFSYIQTIVDESKIMGQFVLSGSQNFNLMQNISQSLAGRVGLFKLFPFDFSELKSEGLLNSDYISAMIKGFYPAIFDRQISSKVFYSNYVQTYVQRDVSELISIKDARLFQNFLGLCAARAGQILNISSIATECGISQPTAKAWLSALEKSYIVSLLNPYFENLSKRIVKSPKLYFLDTGLLSFLLNIYEKEKLISHPLKGNIFENMMVAEYLKRMNHNYDIREIWYWRDSAGHEVDLIIKEGVKLSLIEFKAGMTIMPDMFKGIKWFSDLYGDNINKKIIVYGGDENQNRTNGDVVSWKDFGN
ncbi:MAG: ATP-binding protein [Prolixibacteraceae bacterium]|nr:ATP-binding protein [Prolixibacteraceae bacterium]